MACKVFVTAQLDERAIFVGGGGREESRFSLPGMSFF